MYSSRIFEFLRGSSKGEFPKKLNTLWAQGWGSAPDLVKFNLGRWAELNPDYSIMTFDYSSGAERIGEFPIDLSTLSVQAFSDVLRAKILMEEGGVWVDATVLPTVPLSSWLGSCLRRASFFAYEAPAADRLVSSWFIAARRGSLIMERWWDATVTYWCKPRELAYDDTGRVLVPSDPADSISPDVGALWDIYPYFWFHYLFSYLVKTDRRFRRAWAKTPKKSAVGPHTLQALFEENLSPATDKVSKAFQTAEMQKLHRHGDYPLDILASCSYGR